MAKYKTRKGKTPKGKSKTGGSRRKYKSAKLRRIAVYNKHRHCRWFTDPDTIVLAKNTGGVVGLGRSFQLDEIKNFSELTSLYDQYKITHIKAYASWSPFAGLSEDTAWNAAGASASAALGSGMLTPILWFMPDYDDDSTPTMAEIEQSSRAKCVRLNPHKTFKFNIKPATLTAVYQAVTSAYSPKWKTRLDCANDDVPHYGMKWVAQYLNNINLDMGQITIKYKAYLTMYDAR